MRWSLKNAECNRNKLRQNVPTTFKDLHKNNSNTKLWLKIIMLQMKASMENLKVLHRVHQGHTVGTTALVDKGWYSNL